MKVNNKSENICNDLLAVLEISDGSYHDWLIVRVYQPPVYQGCDYMAATIELPQDNGMPASFDPTTAYHDGDEIIRRRDKDFNGYILDGEVFEATRGSVPKKILDILRLGDVNVQRQLDPPFRLSMSSGEVSRYINNLVDLSRIDERPGRQYTMNCLYFGCIHQINDDCQLKGKETCDEV